MLTKKRSPLPQLTESGSSNASASGLLPQQRCDNIFLKYLMTRPKPFTALYSRQHATFPRRHAMKSSLGLRGHGISEVHIWGKVEIEDQLVQPKNDNLLFAYFGISLQIRKRSIRTALRAKLAMKRKVMRCLGDGWNENKVILLRDPEDERYPYIDNSKDGRKKYSWCLTEFRGNEVDCIKIGWRQYFAYLDVDGKKWDVANVFNDESYLFVHNPWRDETEIERLTVLENEVREFCINNIARECRGVVTVECLLKYEDILEIDEK
jgi:hypothetical protein